MTHNTIVLGDADGPKEKGLVQTPHIVTDSSVLECWHGDLNLWLRENVHSDNPRTLITELIALAKAGTVDANRLDEYVATALEDPATAVAQCRDQLWILNLLPDKRALDTGVSASRLALNVETRQFLLSASDTPRDSRRLKQLSDAAATSNQTATAALRYRASRARGDLEKVELEELLGLFQTKPGTTPPSTPRPLELLDLLDAAEGSSVEDVDACLKTLRETWDLDSDQSTALIAEFQPVDVDEPREVRVTVEPTPIQETLWIGDGAPDRQVVAYTADRNAVRDWLPFPGGGTAVSATALLNAARAQDAVVGNEQFERLVTEYIAARGELAKYERWLRLAAFPLLLLFTAAREAVRAYLDAWQALTQAATDAPPEDSFVIRGAVLPLEALWGSDQGQPEWCVLGPLHPYVLDPLLRIANDTLESLGGAEVGEKASWALDRSLPAYRAVWTLNDTLFLSRRDEIVEFQKTPLGHHPAASSGDGLVQVCRAFLGFHPYAEQAFGITLINPPKGGAVARNLRRLERLVGDLRVYLVTTSSDATQLEELRTMV